MSKAMDYLFIINKNGSLIYDKSFNSDINLNSNEIINMASIFYSMHAISSKLTPNGYEKTSDLKLENNGIESIEAYGMNTFCFQTLTKMSFLFVTSAKKSKEYLEAIFRKIYDVYSDMVSKNPFYELDMPIRIDAFETAVANIVNNS